jgi:alpha-amylase
MDSSEMNIDFKPVEWSHTTNIYEVNVRQYTKEGTFNAFTKELLRLKEMGVRTLWFMPVYPIGKERRKGTAGSYYSIQNYTQVSADYGTLEDFGNLVKTAHTLGFKVMLDWVANHTSWDHVWTKTHPDFFSKDNMGNFRPPFPDWEDVIDLNYDNKELWHEMIKDMKFWVNEFDIDGFRCDMAHLVPLDFWRQARKEIDLIKPLFWLGETEESNYHSVFDASYTWEFLHKTESYWRKETSIAGLDSVLNKYDTAFPPGALRIYFTSNHDENSHSGSEYERMGDLAKAFAVLCATWNSIPLVYSGQELPNKKRLKFFDKDEIGWTGSYELHDFYKTLLTLHSAHPALRAGDDKVKTFRIKTSDDTDVFAYLRKNSDKEVLVLLNLSPNNNLFTITDEMVSGSFENVFTNTVNDFSAEKKIEIPAWEYLVYEK